MLQYPRGDRLCIGSIESVCIEYQCLINSILYSCSIKSVVLDPYQINDLEVLSKSQLQILKKVLEYLAHSF